MTRSTSTWTDLDGGEQDDDDLDDLDDLRSQSRRRLGLAGTETQATRPCTNCRRACLAPTVGDVLCGLCKDRICRADAWNPMNDRTR